MRCGAKPQGSGDGSPPAGFRGEALLGGLGDEVSQKLKDFKSSYKQILRIFGSILHIFTYICPCFSVLAGIIPQSLRNGGGVFDTVCPLVCKWGGGQLPLCPPPGSAAYGDNRPGGVTSGIAVFGCCPLSKVSIEGRLRILDLVCVFERRSEIARRDADGIRRVRQMSGAGSAGEVTTRRSHCDAGRRQLRRDSHRPTASCRTDSMLSCSRHRGQPFRQLSQLI